MSAAFKHALGSSRIYALTDRGVSGLSHLQQVERLSERGIRLIQLREKLLPSRDFYQAAVAVMRIARDRDVRVIINDRVDIALLVKADGVHLGQDDIPAEAARQLLGPLALIGVSTHTLEQAQLAAQLPVDYIATGPIFSTSSKENPDNPLGLEGLKRIREHLPYADLVAIGGLTEAKFEETLAAGADALAVISDLWKTC
jgi:thiamine-phosphate pyrophosphorylase